MEFGGFQSDFNFRRASDRHHLPNLGTGVFLPSHETNPFQKQSGNNNGLDLCKKLSNMGMSCDFSILSGGFGSSGFNDQNLSGASSIHDGFRRGSSVREAFLQSSNFHGSSSPGELRLLGCQDSFNPNGFEEMMGLKNHHRDFHGSSSPRELRLLGVQDSFNGFEEMMTLKNHHRDFHGSSSPRELRLLGVQDSFNGFEEMMTLKNHHRDFHLDHIMKPTQRITSAHLRGIDTLMFEENRVSRALATTEVSGASYLNDSTIMGQKFTTGLDFPLSLVSMIDIYGSLNLMAKNQIGCRLLQKMVEEGTKLDAKFIFLEIIDHVVELSMDPFGNYFVQKLLDVSDDKQRTLLVSVLTLNPKELIKICLNTYGTRVVQKMIETVNTKEQIELVKLSLKPGFLTLVKDLNGNHVIQCCLQSLSENDKKFVLEAATKYCAEIAVHRHGCCVLQCCVSNTVGSQREKLVTEISRNSLQLSQDPFGNYVVQFLIEQQVSAVNFLVQFRMHYAKLAAQKFSSHVIEKCLRHYPESRAEIVRELLSVPNFEQLLQDPYANYVIQTALSVTKGAVKARLVERIRRSGKIQSSPYCKKIFSKTILKK